MLLLALAAFLILGVGLSLRFEPWLASLRERPAGEARQALSSLFQWSTAMLCASVLAVGIQFWLAGVRVREAARFPYPGAKRVWDTPVLVGEPAVARGRLLQVIGVLLLVCGLGVVVLAWRVFRVLTAGEPA